MPPSSVIMVQVSTASVNVVVSNNSSDVCPGDVYPGDSLPNFTLFLDYHSRK